MCVARLQSITPTPPTSNATILNYGSTIIFTTLTYTSALANSNSADFAAMQTLTCTQVRVLIEQPIIIKNPISWLDFYTTGI